MGSVAQLDWVAKLRVLEGYRRARRARAGRDPKLRAIDLQYHDVRRDKGLYHRLAATGKVERLTTDAEVEAAIDDPPGGHARVVPGPLHPPVPRRDRGGLVGLVDPRHGTRGPPARADA